MKNKKFYRLTKEYFNQLIARYPEMGSFLGLHKYDGIWSVQTPEKYLEDIKFFQDYLRKFQKINPHTLNKKERLDRKIVIHDIKLSIFGLKKLRFWESDPDALEEIGSALFLLIVRNHIPLKERIEKVKRGLENLPKVLKEAKSRLTRPYRLWTEIAIESCVAMELFLKEIQSLSKELEKSVIISLRAIKEYKKFLKQDLLPKSLNKYSIGKEKFEGLIQLREIGLGLDQILKIGESALKEDKKNLREIANKIDPALNVKEIEEKIKTNHPKNFDQVIKEYKKSVARARKFITANHLMPVPADEEVIIKETPGFLAHTTPFAAYFPPTKFDREKIGIYIVTPSKRKGILKKHNFAAISNTSVHEAYPGHHLQFVWGYKNPSLVRTLSDATEMVEGWAHYCEEYMREIGYNKKPEIEFIQTLDEIWRAARIIIDVKLHTGKMSFDQAVRFLARETDMAKEDAIAEIKRYTKSPSYQLSYLIGKYLFKKLKNDIKKKMGKKYSDKFFHETILKAGAIPIKYLREEFELKLKSQGNLHKEEPNSPF
jgi:uncharacterized protein (DUF885 family)